MSIVHAGLMHWEFSVVNTSHHPTRQLGLPIPDDITQYIPGRPPVYVYPCRVNAAKVVQGRAVVTCRFVLLPLSGTFQAGEVHTVVFATI